MALCKYPDWSRSSLGTVYAHPPPKATLHQYQSQSKLNPHIMYHCKNLLSVKYSPWSQKNINKIKTKFVVPKTSVGVESEKYIKF